MITLRQIRAESRRSGIGWLEAWHRLRAYQAARRRRRDGSVDLLIVRRVEPVTPEQYDRAVERIGTPWRGEHHGQPFSGIVRQVQWVEPGRTEIEFVIERVRR